MYFLGFLRHTVTCITKLSFLPSLLFSRDFLANFTIGQLTFVRRLKTVAYLFSSFLSRDPVANLVFAYSNRVFEVLSSFSTSLERYHMKEVYLFTTYVLKHRA